VSQDEPDLAECRTYRQSLLIDPQQQSRFGTHERQAHEGAHLLRSERSEIQPRRGLATDDARQELEPAVQHGAHRVRDDRVGPARGDHLLKDPDVPGGDVDVEECAGPLPTNRKGHRFGVHLGLSVYESSRLGGQHGDDQLTLRSEVRWVPASRWLPAETITAMAELSTADAQAGLIGCWLDRFGPGTLADLRWWTGFTVREIRAALAAIEPDEVALDDGGLGYVLASDIDPPLDAPSGSAVSWVALLPPLDPTVMGWRDRDWYLGEHARALFDRNGNAGPTIWIDGRVVGGWAQRRDGSVSHRVLEDVGVEAGELVETEVERLRRWLGDRRVLPRFRTPLELEPFSPDR